MQPLIKSPTSETIERWFLPSLRAAPAYSIDRPEHVEVKLDQNEMPFDWDEDFKARVLDEVRRAAWQRYPHAFSMEVNQLLADYVGVASDNILTGPGSDFLLPLMIRTLAKRIGPQGKIVIARPSFPLYEACCRYEGLDYVTWNLDDHLQYNLNTLPALSGPSLLIFASPNNPVGNVLSHGTLRAIFAKNPETVVIADEAYWEFTGSSFVGLMGEFDRLLVVRTFSKNLGAAGLRVGFLIAAAEWIAQFKKLRVPYALNIFAVCAMRVLLTGERYAALVKTRTETVIRGREDLRARLSVLPGMNVHPSHANFLLLQFPSQTACMNVYRFLIEQGILLRNVSAGPGLEGCLRATIGTPEENEKLATALQTFFKK